MNRTAKEMFEELGYEYTFYQYKYRYRNEERNTFIEIDDCLKTIRVSQIDKEYTQTINYWELKAIQEKIEELGWNE